MTMSKPLSEQVATLETDLAEALADISWLEHEITDLRIENAELRAGQGRWPTGYADDDHQDAEVTQWHEPGPTAKMITTPDMKPRLTVHKLNVAPVGSRLERLNRPTRKKSDDGRWHKAWMFEDQRAETSEELIDLGWADATLVLPEEQP